MRRLGDFRTPRPGNLFSTFIENPDCESSQGGRSAAISPDIRLRIAPFGHGSLRKNQEASRLQAFVFYKPRAVTWHAPRGVDGAAFRRGMISSPP